MSNSPKNKIKLPKPAEPRTREIIQQLYAQESQKLANATYLEYVYGIDRENINKSLLSLNQEAAARNELDKAAQKELPNDSNQPQS